MNKILLDKHRATLVYTGAKLGSDFNTKDITKTEHKHDLVYRVKYPEETCNKTNNDVRERRLVERIDEQRVKDKNLHVYQHFLVTLDDFAILNFGYRHS